MILCESRSRVLLSDRGLAEFKSYKPSVLLPRTEGRHRLPECRAAVVAVRTVAVVRKAAEEPSEAPVASGCNLAA